MKNRLSKLKRKRLKIVKTNKIFFLKILLQILVISIALVVVVLINSKDIQILWNNDDTIITSENYELKKGLFKTNRLIRIKGHIDPYRMVEETNQKNEEVIYYSALKEFPNEIILKFNPSSLSFGEEVYEGRLVKITDIKNHSEIRDKLNTALPIENVIGGSVDIALAPEDETLINKLSEAGFDDNVWVILADKETDLNALVVKLILWSGSLSLLLLLIFNLRLIRLKRGKSLVNNQSHPAHR